MTVEWMNHTGLPVANMEKALSFYKEFFGLSVDRDSVLAVSYTHLTLPTKA